MAKGTSKKVSLCAAGSCFLRRESRKVERIALMMRKEKSASRRAKRSSL